MQKGFKLTFPDGKVFELTSMVKVEDVSEENPFAGGGPSQLAGLLGDFIAGGGTDDRFDSGAQSPVISFGAGVDRFQITITQATGPTGSDWGGVPSDAGPRTKADYFHHAVQTNDVDSRNPVVYEGGEFSSTGDFVPIDVMVESSSLSADAPDEASTFSGQIQLLDILDVEQGIDIARAPTDR